MRPLLFVVGVLAVVAIAQAAPLVEDDTDEQYRVNELVEKLRTRIDAIKAKMVEVKSALLRAEGADKEELKKHWIELRSELVGVFSDLRDALRGSFSKGDSYSADESYIIQTIQNLREKLQAKLRELKVIVEKAKIGSEQAKIEARKTIEKIKEEIFRLRDEIHRQLRDIFLNRDETYTFEADDYIVNDLIEILKVKIGQIREKMNEVKKQLIEATGERRTALLNKWQELQIELRGALSDIKNAMRDIFSKKDSYAIEFNDEVYIVETVRGLREQLKEKLRQLKEVAEVIKTEFAETKRQAQQAFEDLKVEIGKIHEDIRGQIGSIFERNLEAYVVDNEQYLVQTIKDALKVKISDLKEQMKAVQDKITKAAGQKKAELIEHFKLLQEELKGAFHDVKDAMKDIFAKNEESYAIEEGQNVSYILDTVRGLRSKLQEKLNQLREMAELAKDAAALIKQETSITIQTIKEEIVRIRDDIKEQIKDMFTQKGQTSVTEF